VVGLARGLLGVFYLAASIILTPRLGAANTVAFVLAGQVLASMSLDQFGLLNLPVHSISLARLGGALVIAGVFVVLRT
jgi:bacterial/archaeal transporter family-2 protein